MRLKGFGFIAALLMGHAGAQPIVGVTWEGRVFELDSETGSVVSSRTSTIPRMNSLASLPDGRLVTVSGGFSPGQTFPNRLAYIDPVSGEESFGPLLDALRPLSIRALAASGDLLFGVLDQNSDADDQLVRINTATGETTVVGSIGTPGGQSLAFGPDGMLYTWEATRIFSDDDIRIGAGLLMVDPATGNTTDVFDNDTAWFFQSISFDRQGNIFGVTSDTITGLGTNNSLYRIDPQNGDSSLIGSFSRGLDVRGIQVIPTPGTASSLTVVIMMASTRRRRLYA